MENNLKTEEEISVKKENKLVRFFKDSYTEMTEHVTWSSYSELQDSSILVIVGSLIFALLIGAMDFSFKSVLDMFYESF